MSEHLTWWVGDQNASISDQLTAGGSPVDLSSATVRFKMRGPLDGGNSNATVKVDQPMTFKDAQGNWRYDWQTGDLDTPGFYLVWLVVTVASKPQTLWESIIEVRAHDGSHLYVELEQAKSTFELKGRTFADADVFDACNAASRAIDDACSPSGQLTRRFWKDADAAQVRYYSPWDRCELRIHDLVELTSVQTDAGGDGTFEQTWTLNTDFVLEPLNAAADAWPFDKLCRHPRGSYYFPTAYPRTVKVTGRYGWPAVPAPIKDATTILIGRLVKRKREAPLGIVPGGLDQIAVRIARTDPDIQALIERYVRTGVPFR